MSSDPSTAVPAGLVEIIARGVLIAEAFMDGLPGTSSPVATLDQRRSRIPPGSWPAGDIALLNQALRGYVGVAGRQLAGVTALLAGGQAHLLAPVGDACSRDS